MKTPTLITTLLLIGILTLITGCANNLKPPTTIEQRLFTVITNTVPTVIYQTNQVPQTNYVILTNAAGLVATTPLVTSTPVILVMTNQTPQYSFAPNTTAAMIQGVAGGVGSLFGVGGIVSTAVSGLFVLYASMRSKKANQVSGVLAQGIELAKSVMATMPGAGGGDKLVSAFTDKLMKNQLIAGVGADVAKIIDTHVDTDTADTHAATVVANAVKS